MAIYIYIAQSLDGYIADKDGGVGWLNDIPNPSGSDFGFGEFMEGIDALVMGRNTFETVAGFGVWPYTKPVFVISSTLVNLPEEFKDKAFLLDLPPIEIINHLKMKGMEDLYIDGGSLIQSFLAEDLIDNMIITTVPVLLGGGIALFGDLDQSQNFELISSQVLTKTLVKNHYQKIDTTNLNI